MNDNAALARGKPGSITNLRHDSLADLARWALTYSLAIIFLAFGASKFTAMSGEALAPLIMNSPLVSWLHSLFGIDGAARALGVFEILTGLLIAARSFSPRLSVIGGAMAIVTFVVTLSFLFSTPKIATGNPFPLSMLGEFLFKDLVLLGVAFWIFATSLAEARANR